MPADRDPNDYGWFGDFFASHVMRFPTYPWPDSGTKDFLVLAESWLAHFRNRRIRFAEAEHASLALQVQPHHTNQHMARFFDCLPSRPLERIRMPDDVRLHYLKGEGRHGRPGLRGGR